MKHLAILIGAFSIISNRYSYAADVISCIGPQKGRLTLTRIQTKKNFKQIRFELELDEVLSSKYLGEIFDRSIAPDKTDPLRILSTSDGNSSITIRFEFSDFTSATRGATSDALIEIMYDDISTDYVKHHLECTMDK